MQFPQKLRRKLHSIWMPNIKKIRANIECCWSMCYISMNAQNQMIRTEERANEREKAIGKCSQSHKEQKPILLNRFSVKNLQLLWFLPKV